MHRFKINEIDNKRLYLFLLTLTDIAYLNVHMRSTLIWRFILFVNIRSRRWWLFRSFHGTRNSFVNIGDRCWRDRGWMRWWRWSSSLGHQIYFFFFYILITLWFSVRRLSTWGNISWNISMFFDISKMVKEKLDID